MHESQRGATAARGTGEPRRRRWRVEHGVHDDGVAAQWCGSGLPTSAAVATVPLDSLERWTG